MVWYEFALVQIGVLIVVYMFCRWQNKRDARRPQKANIDCSSESAELKKMRNSSLSMPLAEITRPKKLDDIIGQQDAINALRAALCGKNPQHIIIYGPPGVGKTCAARLLLEEAKKNPVSPFSENSKFIELDATCIRFDERAIADPLLGCVHDPIYQGAGAFGVQGIPQPKPGAVTKAHCGVLFLDEIGELHPLQMNKLLKVLEDRRVYFESSYYSKTNTGIPPYIHDVFQNGLPADFRLIGATTRSPSEIPPALRSRCVEIYFSPLSDSSLVEIGKRAATITGAKPTASALSLCAAYSESGRDCVNIMQLAGSLCKANGEITSKDIEWVAKTCRYSRKYTFTMQPELPVGTALGLGVSGCLGTVLEIECNINKNNSGCGKISINGAVQEEEIEAGGKKLRRKSLIYSSAENVLFAIKNVFGIDCNCYDISYNIPGGLPVDGPSAGVALLCALMSALTNKPLKPYIAMTGEVTQNGSVRAVGGVHDKAAAAKAAGAECVIVPKDNERDAMGLGVHVIAVSNVKELVRALLIARENEKAN